MTDRVHEIALLLRIQLFRLGGVNSLIHGHDRRQRRRALGVMGISLLLCAMAAAYSGMIAFALAQMGAGEMIPQVLALAGAMLTLAVMLMKGPEWIFGGGETLTLRAMPVRTSSIVISRVLGVMGPEIGFALLIGTPAAAVLVQHGWNVGFGVRLILALCLIPAIPMAVGLLLGIVVAHVTLRLRHRALAGALLSGAFVLAGMYGAFSLGFAAESGRLTDAMMLVLTRRFAQLLTGLYWPADWTLRAAQGEAGAWLLLTSTAALALAALCAFATIGFERVCDGLNSGSVRRKVKRAGRHSKSPLFALYEKEWARYTSSSVYMMNTAMGWVIYAVMTAAVCLMEMDWILAMIAGAGVLVGDILLLIPLIPGMLAGMSETTAAAISLEGRQMDWMRAAPVRMCDWLGAKLLVNMTLAVPVSLLCGALVSWRLSLGAVGSALMVLFPMLSALLVGEIGLMMGLCFPRFDWENETQVVKNGLATTLTILMAMVFPLVIGGLALWINDIGRVMMAVCAAYALMSVVLWRALCRMRMP